MPTLAENTLIGDTRACIEELYPIIWTRNKVANTGQISGPPGLDGMARSQ
jgi:hypothetical protein